MTTELTLSRATLGDLDAVAPLFDAYRQFYAQAADLPGARAFIQARLTQRDSVIILAHHRAVPVGFTQLYPSFSSVAMARIFVLNDLFVLDEARRLGVARALIEGAARHGTDHGAVRLDLSTAHTNTAAQGLYESLGWQLDSAFRSYSLALT